MESDESPCLRFDSCFLGTLHCSMVACLPFSLVVFGSSICRRGVFLFVVLVPRVATGKESTCRSLVPMTADGIRLTPNPFACLEAFFFSIAALLSTVAVKLLLEVKKRSKISSPTRMQQETTHPTQTKQGKGELKFVCLKAEREMEGPQS